MLHSEEDSARQVEEELGWRVLRHELGAVLGDCAFWRQTASVTALVTAVAQKDLAGYADPERGDGIAEPHP